MVGTEMNREIEEYMVYCYSRQLSKKTMANYEQSLRLFEKWCGNAMKIDDAALVTEAVIRRYINYIRNLRAFFNWLEQECVLRKNPMKRIKQLKNSRRPKEYITNEDFKKLAGVLDKSYFSEHRDYAAIVLMLDSGMRLGECLCLTVDDVHLTKRYAVLRAEVTKGRRQRLVYFLARTENILRRWIQFKDRYVETDALFPVKASGLCVGVSNFETNFKGYLRRAGLKETITPHCLRNNFAKRCLMNGMDIYTLSKLLGHSNVTITEKAYLDLTDEDIGKRYQNYSPIAAL